jgi:hypothetical protein
MQVFVSKLSLRFISIMRALRQGMDYGSSDGETFEKMWKIRD